MSIHVHLRNADGTAKFKIDPSRLIESKGMQVRDLALAEALVEEKREEIIEQWKKYMAAFKGFVFF